VCEQQTISCEYWYYILGGYMDGLDPVVDWLGCFGYQLDRLWELIDLNTTRSAWQMFDRLGQLHLFGPLAVTVYNVQYVLGCFRSIWQKKICKSKFAYPLILWGLAQETSVPNIGEIM